MKIDELVPVYVERMPDTIKVGLLYISNDRYACSHLCACGCGGETYLPLKPQNQDGWDLTEKEGGIVTLRPSIGNWKGQNPYHAHYYITNNKIEWL